MTWQLMPLTYLNVTYNGFKCPLEKMKIGHSAIRSIVGVRCRWSYGRAEGIYIKKSKLNVGAICGNIGFSYTIVFGYMPGGHHDIAVHRFSNLMPFFC